MMNEKPLLSIEQNIHRAIASLDAHGGRPARGDLLPRLSEARYKLIGGPAPPRVAGRIRCASLASLDGPPASLLGAPHAFGRVYVAILELKVDPTSASLMQKPLPAGDRIAAFRRAEARQHVVFAPSQHRLLGGPGRSDVRHCPCRRLLRASREQCNRHTRAKHCGDPREIAHRSSDLPPAIQPPEHGEAPADDRAGTDAPYAATSARS